MIPFKDSETPRYRTPYINIILIGINAFVFLYMIFLTDLETIAVQYRYGLIASELLKGGNLDYLSLNSQSGLLRLDISTPVPTWATIFTSMFLHGGWMHFLGNMLYLWVFGDNMESRLGHFPYLFFYIITGVAAAASQLVVSPDSNIPLIGASGAISGVLGAYLLTYPYHRITTLVIFVFISVIHIPAVYVLGFWFILQLLNGLGSIGPLGGLPSPGVAYMAHVGGFAAGIILMALYKLTAGQPIWPKKEPFDYF